jgi:hypothetical protein
MVPATIIMASNNLSSLLKPLSGCDMVLFSLVYAR